MAEYIERDDAIKAVKGQISITMTRAALADAIKSIPAADVAPVVHGKWSKHFWNGSIPEEGWVSSCCDMWNEHRAHYCPNCGAKMDGGADNETAKVATLDELGSLHARRRRKHWR